MFSGSQGELDDGTGSGDMRVDQTKQGGVIHRRVHHLIVFKRAAEPVGFNIGSVIDVVLAHDHVRREVALPIAATAQNTAVGDVSKVLPRLLGKKTRSF